MLFCIKCMENLLYLQQQPSKKPMVITLAKKKQALIIKTADCMPVMLSSGSQIFGLHIGWRSLAKKILTESILHTKTKENINLWVGPHIQQNRFSLDMKSLEELLSPHKLSIKKALSLGIIKPSFEQKKHYLVSLKDILLKEAFECGISNFYSSDIDTYWSCNHYSHRRNPNRKGTNYSFILKI